MREARHDTTARLKNRVMVVTMNTVGNVGGVLDVVLGGSGRLWSTQTEESYLFWVCMAHDPYSVAFCSLSNRSTDRPHQGRQGQVAFGKAKLLIDSIGAITVWKGAKTGESHSSVGVDIQSQLNDSGCCIPGNRTGTIL